MGAGFPIDEGKGFYGCAEIRDECAIYEKGERCTYCSTGICINRELLKELGKLRPGLERKIKNKS